MRTKTEILLLNLRQRHFDALAALRASQVVDIQAFRKAYVLYKICDDVLADYRSNEKFKDVA